MSQPEASDVQLEEVGAVTALAEAGEGSAPGGAKTKGRLRRFGRGVWRVIRALLIVALLVSLGIIIYYGWPLFQERFIDPVESNAAGVAAVEERVDALDARVADLFSLTGDLGDEVDALAAAEADVPDRLAALEEAQASMLAAQEALELRADQIDDQIEAATGRLDAIDELQAGFASDLTLASDAVGREVAMLRSMELLSRARLFLFQSNYGLAEQDVQAARNILFDLREGAAAGETAVLDETVRRLDLTLAALPGFPVAAAGDLDIAWGVLLGDIPAAAPEATTTTTTTVATETTTP